MTSPVGSSVPGDTEKGGHVGSPAGSKPQTIHDLEACEAADHPDEGDGVCACGAMVYGPPLPLNGASS